MGLMLMLMLMWLWLIGKNDGGSDGVDTRVSNRFNPHLFTFARQYSYFLPISRLKRMGMHLDKTLFEKSLQELTGTHYMKNYSGSVRHRNKGLRQFYVRTV